MSRPDDVWAGFSRDPRDPEHAVLRASDADRDVVHGVLAEAYADGRLDREELDSRTQTTHSARTLGDLLGPLDGLVARTPAVPAARTLAATDLDQRAVATWESDRREALWGLVSVSAIVWVIWLVTSGVDSFPWPVFVTLAVALNVGRVQFQRSTIIAEHRERLEREQRKEIEKRRREEDS